MKAFVPLVLFLALAVLAAGCTGSQSTATPAPTSVEAVTPTLTTAPTVSFTLGEKYLEKKYSFTSEKDKYQEQFRVTSDPWGIELTVNPTNEDPQYTWFEITLTQMDTGSVDKYGYGREYGLEKHQLIPMYTSGPYQVELTGNRVSVNVNIAKRNP